MRTNFNIESIWGNDKKISLWDRLFKRSIIPDKPLTTPKIIGQNCEGLFIGGKNVKSFLFSTDMALIENNDSDAVLAVYPFTPSPRIMKALIDFSEKPVICGVGGGTTQGKRSLEMAMYAEEAGASGIIVNIPFKSRDIESIRKRISIPIISSISAADKRLKEKINAGVDVFHVTAGKNTNEIVKAFVTEFPNFPLMATGGKRIQDIKESINAGADAIVLTPPSNTDLFKTLMDKYRKIKYLKI